MRIFVAGATGAVGRPLVRMLVADGHEVSGLTRSAEKAQGLEAAGARPVVANAFDTGALLAAVKGTKPDVVIDQLTDLPQKVGVRGMTKMYRHQNAIRKQGSAALLDAARAADVSTVISQSVAFLYAPDGRGPKSENDRVWRDGPPPAGQAYSVAADHDEAVVASPDFTGIVLRYGVLYGPGTHFAPGNFLYDDARRGRLPLVGNGDGVWCFAHVEDCAQATLAVLGRSMPGIYNIVDDDPAPYREWVTYWIELVGGRKPMHVPRRLARVIAGPAATAMATVWPGASNAKAKRELGWSPRHPSWREGLAQFAATVVR